MATKEFSMSFMSNVHSKHFKQIDNNNIINTFSQL